MKHSILFDHIAFAVPKIADTTRFLVGHLGGESHGGAPAGSFIFWQWRYRGGGVIEILEPDGPPGGFLHRYLERHGAGCHHVTFKVENLEAVCERAVTLGYDVVGYEASDPAWKEAFLHPKQAQGIVVQFAESHPELHQGVRPKLRPPRSPPPPERRARVVGLRLRSRDADVARTQWQELIGGASERDANGDLVFRWQGSPMRIVVETDPGQEPGPIAVELEGLDEGLEASYGADFVEPSVGGRFLVRREGCS